MGCARRAASCVETWGGLNVPRIVIDDARDFLDYRDGSGGTVEIYDIQVCSERRRGKGRRLVYTLYKRIKPEVKLVWAITRTDNLIAQQFYEELRFRVVAVLRDFYKDESKPNGTADAIMFGRDIGSQA